MGTVLGFDLSYYAIVGGEGKRRIEGRIVSMVNEETIVCVATKQEYMEKKRDRKSTRLNSSHSGESRMPSSA